MAEWTLVPFKFFLYNIELLGPTDIWGIWCCHSKRPITTETFWCSSCLSACKMIENCLLCSPFTYFLSPIITEKTIGSCERVLSPDRLRLRAYWDIMTEYRPTAHISDWKQAHRLQSITSHVCFAFIDRAKSSPRPARVWNAAFVLPWRKWRNYERGIYIVQRNDQSSRARWRWRTEVVRWLMRHSARQIQSRVCACLTYLPNWRLVFWSQISHSHLLLMDIRGFRLKADGG